MAEVLELHGFPDRVTDLAVVSVDIRWPTRRPDGRAAAVRVHALARRQPAPQS
jgi:hypothetical protein